MPFHLRTARRRIVALGAVGALLLLGAAGLLRAMPDGDAPSHSPQDVHLAAMRDAIARVHQGKVDPATMERIVAMLVRLHERLPAGESSALSGTPEVDVLATPQALRFLGGGRPDTTPHATARRVADNLDFPPNRTYVGQKTCEGCHQQEATNWAHTVHAKIFGLNPRDSTEALGCEACHGPGSDHVKNPSDLSTIISFSSKSRTPVARQNAQCLSCHQGSQRLFWHDSIHETNGLSCSDCHNPMSNFASRGLTARESINDTCFACHKDIRAQFSERSHMPLLEGKITCVDCHNPHGSTTEPLLKADSVNEVCYGCHAEKRGPFLFEHAPVRENCLNCHNPHGSNFEALLVAPRPILCQQCHAQSGHPAQLMTQGNMAGGAMPDPRLIATSCQTCHVNIHGSNDPSGARFER